MSIFSTIESLTNLHIQNALERLGMEKTKTYRIYEKPLIARVTNESLQ